MSAIPQEVDVIIIGTGLTNSIVAAACSRIGKSVLHLDENSYYGNDWASFTFQQLVDWIKEKLPDDKSLRSIPEELIRKSRMFCIDLAPRLLYSNGDMVDLLVKSNVARYHEFKNNIRILCSMSGVIRVMPCRRNEVFTSSLLSNLSDKRRLMKFIEFCMKLDIDKMPSEERESLSTTTIKNFLEDRGLRTDLQEYIINSIAMVKPSEETLEVCMKIRKFVIATERYGRSPFLFPLYGCGEFPQSFCRLSAVFGGLYCLNTQVKDVTIPKQSDETIQKSTNEAKFMVRFSDDDHLVKSDILVIERGNAIDLRFFGGSQRNQQYLSRAILITRRSIIPETDQDGSSRPEMSSFLRIPQTDTNSHVTYLIETNSSVLVCPREYHIVYLWTLFSSPSSTSEHDLKPIVEHLYRDNSDSIIWEFYYRQLVGSDLRSDSGDEKSPSPGGLFMTSPSCDDIDYPSNVKEAEELFKQMCPDQDFLPRAPDPDEIVST